MIDSIKKRTFRICLLLLLMIPIAGCAHTSSPDLASDAATQDSVKESVIAETVIPETAVPRSSSDKSVKTPIRDNTPVVLVPKATGSVTYSNPTETAVIDASHTSDGYIMANYTGTNPKVKLLITGINNVTYSYDLHGTGYEVFPLTSGNGVYTVAIYEHLVDSRYSMALSKEIDAVIENEFSPYLYPNQYVNFDDSAKAIALAADLAAKSSTDLDAISSIYNYIISHISYDHDKANNVQRGYLPDIDDTLATGEGICFDYAAVMASMLRSQRIPTRLEIGYSGESYHAWISTYIAEIGWINGIIEFDGRSWILMDPTFAASSSEKALKKFIGDGTNYITEYVY